VFERFTERARKVLVLAQDEARGLRHNYIGTEHILLGLMREEEGLAAQALASLGLVIDDIRAEVARIVGEGDEITSRQIPFTPRSKKVLELSLREALSVGHFTTQDLIRARELTKLRGDVLAVARWVETVLRQDLPREE
jgi:ATP-dependent Clp protease ATP-binding subunit ClpC